MFESEEWRTIKWEIMLDILVINFCFIFWVIATDNKKVYNNFSLIPTLLPTYRTHNEWMSTKEGFQQQHSKNFILPTLQSLLPHSLLIMTPITQKINLFA